MQQDTARLILVVDDDADERSLTKLILENGGYEVETRANGRQALEALDVITPDLIILDIMMPELSGYDVMVHIKQHPETQNIPVIMLSAKGDPEDLIVGYKDYGVEYYIPKPFTSRQLLAGVHLVLGD